MKLIVTAIAFACMSPAASLAQTAPAPAPSPAATATAVVAKFTLDTPIEQLVADDKAKAVLTADLGGDVTTNPSYDQFKGMSLHQVQPFAGDKLNDTVMKKIETDLAAIR